MAQPALSYAYDLAYQISPIILVGGIASNVLGNALPIIALTGQSLSLLQGFASNGFNTNDFFARFLPIPGGTLISNTVGTYPFANQQVAANAIIQQPLNISLEMICPSKNTGDYITKLAILVALQNSLQTHVNAGGTFNIATPAFIYTNCLLTGMTDITSGETEQKQVRFQLDFVQPLITQQSANAAFNSLNSMMSNLTGGSQVTSSSWSSLGNAVGTSAQGAAQGISGMTGAVSTFPVGTNPASIGAFSGI